MTSTRRWQRYVQAGPAVVHHPDAGDKEDWFMDGKAGCIFSGLVLTTARFRLVLVMQKLFQCLVPAFTMSLAW